MLKTVNSCILFILIILSVTVRVHGDDLPHNADNNISCTDCHAFHNYALIPRGEAQEALCKTCHNPTGRAGMMSNVSNHVVNGGTTIIDCGFCHDVHSSDISEDPNHPGGVTAVNLSHIRSNPRKYFPEATETIIFQQKPEHFAFEENNPPWNGVCQGCHTETNYHTNDDSGSHSHQMSMGCTTCHSHKSGFMPGGCTNCHDESNLHHEGGYGCTDCHNMHGPERYDYTICKDCHPREGIFGRRQIVGPGGDFDQASVHVSGEVEDDDCLTCHDVTQHQEGVVLMVDPDSGGAAPWIGTGTGFCLSCHDGDPPIDITFPADPNGTGYDKSAFMGTTHENALGDQSCQHCHNSHGASNISLLKNKYITTDYNVWTEGDGDYAACWACHNENAVVMQENAFEKRHDKHVKGEDSPCFICHDMHAPFDAGEPGFIKFEPSIRLSYDIQYIDGRDGSTSFWIDSEQNRGYCYILCHDEDHKPEDYNRDKKTPTSGCTNCHGAPPG